MVLSKDFSEFIALLNEKGVKYLGRWWVCGRLATQRENSNTIRDGARHAAARIRKQPAPTQRSSAHPATPRANSVRPAVPHRDLAREGAAAPTEDPYQRANELTTWGDELQCFIRLLEQRVQDFEREISAGVPGL